LFVRQVLIFDIIAKIVSSASLYKKKCTSNGQATTTIHAYIYATTMASAQTPVDSVLSKLSLLLFAVLLFFNGKAFCEASNAFEYSCQRQAYKEFCSTGLKSQFVWRWYVDNGECHTYPYGYCAGEEEANHVDKTIRYRKDCIAHCIQNTAQHDKYRVRTAKNDRFNYSSEKTNSPTARAGVQTDDDNSNNYYEQQWTKPATNGYDVVVERTNRYTQPNSLVRILGASSDPREIEENSSGDAAENEDVEEEFKETSKSTEQANGSKSVKYSCNRLPYREQCSTGLPSQFTLRWHLHNGECISYPYGYCNGVDNVEEDASIRYKEDCEMICIHHQKLNIIPGQRPFPN
ncbi:hypothetical protein T4B_3440, partial [Trichinella pseudospiralis]